MRVHVRGERLAARCGFAPSRHCADAAIEGGIDVQAPASRLEQTSAPVEFNSRSVTRQNMSLPSMQTSVQMPDLGCSCHNLPWFAVERERLRKMAETTATGAFMPKPLESHATHSHTATRSSRHGCKLCT
eukprot:12274-Chlamydomonas_euryale.AAC.10